MNWLLVLIQLETTILMIVERIYIATYKYDWNFAKICISSIRYWYPEIPICILKDRTAGCFETKNVLNDWNIEEIDLGEKSWGWGFSKLLPMFEEKRESYLVMDADTVLLGPLLDRVKSIDADFIVDEEVQPDERFNEIYYNLDLIGNIDGSFKYPGYSFNSGQVFGTSGILKMDDFEDTLIWSNPPKSKFPTIIPNGDQSQLNFHIHKWEALNKIKVARLKLMIYPKNPLGLKLDLQIIKNKHHDYPMIIHWAGMKYKRITDLNYSEIIFFYRDLFYCRKSRKIKLQDCCLDFYFFYEKKIKSFITRVQNKTKGGD